MSWFGNWIEKFREVPCPYLYILTAKVFGGVGLGLLLATWLPVWTGWIFIAISLLIAIPSARIVLGKAK